MTTLEFAILALATWRVAALFSKEAGPFDVFKRIREKAGITHDENDDVFMVPHKFFAELLSCVWCTSIWVGAFWVCFFAITPQICTITATIFSLSTLAILLDRIS